MECNFDSDPDFIKPFDSNPGQVNTKRQARLGKTAGFIDVAASELYKDLCKDHKVLIIWMWRSTVWGPCQILFYLLFAWTW